MLDGAPTPPLALNEIVKTLAGIVYSTVFVASTSVLDAPLSADVYICAYTAVIVVVPGGLVIDFVIVNGLD